jgi:hypothetical protein
VPSTIIIKGRPVTSIRKMESYNLYSFEVEEIAGMTPPKIFKDFNPGSKIKYTIFATPEQLEKVQLHNFNCKETDLVVLGLLCIDIPQRYAPGDYAVIATTLQKNNAAKKKILCGGLSNVR